MKTDRKISDILWDAANKHLCSPVEDDGDGLWTASCCAVAEAENGHDRCDGSVWVDPDVSKALAYLQEFGIDPCRFGQFDKFESDEETQGARYLWLMFAYQVALSEGV